MNGGGGGSNGRKSAPARTFSAFFGCVQVTPCLFKLPRLALSDGNQRGRAEATGGGQIAHLEDAMVEGEARWRLLSGN